MGRPRRLGRLRPQLRSVRRSELRLLRKPLSVLRARIWLVLLSAELRGLWLLTFAAKKPLGA
jgi:hypothetical protein